MELRRDIHIQRTDIHSGAGKDGVLVDDWLLGRSHGGGGGHVGGVGVRGVGGGDGGGVAVAGDGLR